MQRNLTRAIEDYKSLCKRKGHNFGALYVSDCNQLRKIATDKGGTSFRDIVLHAIDSSYSAGFMIGYRAAKREARKK